MFLSSWHNATILATLIGNLGSVIVMGYKKAGRWKQSIALSKKDNLYKNAMERCSVW
ncbi:hypothetical protein CIPAW_04G119800 [Carya illinoinensis]|uniref:Uncharacterized protein n=1 Tax=Carya illinoinensis TaxID=32201 RepID=A0A8T1QUD2_CARIL|nr:hypothetical protein CIPAW_04G119800 [Carya illinoinensis]